jgi:hypothetical protein
MTTTATVIQKPNDGNHYAPANSLLEGGVADHDDGMAALALNECDYPVDFSPLDYELAGGNMVLWNDDIGGEFPWDSRYFGAKQSGHFDPECKYTARTARLHLILHSQLTILFNRYPAARN